MAEDKKFRMHTHCVWLIWIAATATLVLQTFHVHADQSISQISPKSGDARLLFDENDFNQLSTQALKAEATNSALPNVNSTDVTNLAQDFSNKNSHVIANNVAIDDALIEHIKESESDSDDKPQQHQRILRSASPVLHEYNEHASNEKINLDPDYRDTAHISGRYFNLIQPTSTFNKQTAVDDSSDVMSERSRKDVEDKFPSSLSTSFLLKRGPRLIQSGPPSEQPVSTSVIKPTSATSIELQTATNIHLNSDLDHGRQNQNPDIQDIITGIVKLLNGNVNVHANTQPQLQASRRPYTTRINNRGPPRISDAQSIPTSVEDEYESNQAAPASTMRPPYPFDRHEAPIRPFITGVPLPEQIVPSSNINYRPAFISQQQQNRPPWQRLRPRPPVLPSSNRRPILTPPPYKFTSRPVQELRPPEIVSKLPVQQNIQTLDDLDKPNANNASYEVTELLENEEMMPEIIPLSTSGPTKEDLSKKRDKPKKPNSSMTNLQPQKPNLNVTKSTDSSLMIMKTIIQTTSEVHTSQFIATSMSTPTAIEPSEQTYHTTLQSTTLSSSRTKTPELSQTSSLSPPLSSSLIKQTHPVAAASTIKVSSSEIMTSPKPTSFPTFLPRPGIVLDDPEFKPGGHVRPLSTSSKLYNSIQPTRILQRPPASASTNRPPGYGEIFDVTLSAIQGPGNGVANSGLQTINIKPYGGGNNDIIISASGDDSFVSIDGKRTYINLFGESTEAPNQQPLATKSPITEKTSSIEPTKTINPAVLNTGYAFPNTELPTTLPHSTSQSILQKPLQQATNSQLRPTKPNYRARPQQPPVRIDTCIVGDDSTCDLAQNEKCKTDVGVSSCHCRPGFARRKHREPCRKVVSLLMSLRVDKFYERRIVWDKLLADSNSEPYGHLSYEAIRAIDSAMSMTPFSDEFMDASVNKIYNGDATQGAAGVFVNLTIELIENSQTLRPNIKSDIQKHLLGVIHRRNNNIGNSVLYVESPAGSISNLQDLDECSSADLNDCHAEAACTNVWGSFHCQCASGLRDPWSDQIQRAGRECHSCSDSYCNNRGSCSYDSTGTQQVCECIGNYYGNQCEIDGEVLAVAIGASIIAVIIIILTLICLVMWSRRWHREQKDAMGSPVFGYMSGTALGAAQLKSAQGAPYQVTLEDRMRWAQIADVMAQSNHYAAEPVASSRPPSAMFGYPNLQMMNQMATLSMAGTLPMHHHHPGATLPPIPLPRYGLSLHARANGMRTLENSSSSEEEDRVDLLGRNFQVPRPKSRSNGSIANQSGIYYDVDYEPSGGEMYGGTTTTTTTSCNNNSSSNNNLLTVPGPQGIPMSTYSANRVPTSYYMK